MEPGRDGGQAERNMNNQKILQLAKGFRGRSKNCIRAARERVEKALQYAYRDRRTKKRDMRGLWIQRINAGSRQHGVRKHALCSALLASRCAFSFAFKILNGILERSRFVVQLQFELFKTFSRFACIL